MVLIFLLKKILTQKIQEERKQASSGVIEIIGSEGGSCSLDRIIRTFLPFCTIAKKLTFCDVKFSTERAGDLRELLKARLLLITDFTLNYCSDKEQLHEILSALNKRPKIANITINDCDIDDKLFLSVLRARFCEQD